jgi:hypothetical protein
VAAVAAVAAVAMEELRIAGFGCGDRVRESGAGFELRGSCAIVALVEE